MKHEARQIIHTIKHLLKLQEKRYSDLAEYLGVSLASVKRILNNEDIQISRLAQIARFLGIELYELIEKSKPENQKRYKFSIEQEKFLSKNINHFLILRMLLMNESKKKIKQTLNISELELEKVLISLERIELIEMHPSNVIKNKVHFPVQWIEGGLLEMKYNKLIINKLSKEIEAIGINRKCTLIDTHINIKELLLKKSESLELKNKLLELIRSYDMLTKIRLNSHKDYNVVSIGSIVGEFSWWE